MRLKDVPIHPAYVVSHDAFDKGAMDVQPCVSLDVAQAIVNKRQEYADSIGVDNVVWRAYEKLPRVKVWKYRSVVLSA